MKQARIKLLKQMNQYIIDLGDEEVWLEWITEGVPDEASEDDYDYIASNEDEWLDTVKIFANLTKEYWED